MNDFPSNCLLGDGRRPSDISGANPCRPLSTHALRKRRALPVLRTPLPSKTLNKREDNLTRCLEVSDSLTHGSLKRRRQTSSSDDSTATQQQQEETFLRDECSFNEAQSPWCEVRSSDAIEIGDIVDYPNPEALCAEVLQQLRAGKWDSDRSPVSPPTTPSSPFTGDSSLARPVGSKAIKRSRRGAFAGAPRRKYTWRSFHHRGKEYEHVTDGGQEAPEPTSDDTSGSSHKERDKEWAALTTWLRMNLHQPRTNKRQVLFTANVPKPGGTWTFRLNNMLTWGDVSEETKLRLKTLPEETEAAFAHKYPNRPAFEWQTKTQKYKPGGSDTTIQVPLGEMVLSLRDMYNYHEGSLP